MGHGMQNFEVRLPDIPETQFVITEYGAVNGGKASNTKAFAKAIQAAAEAGGGTVVIPAGLWLTGPIELVSNINLHAQKGAVVIFDKNKEEYPVFLTDYEGLPRIRTVSPIHAREAENIAITGEGIFDGSGQLWRPLKEFKVTKRHWKKNLKTSPYVIDTKEGGIWLPSESIYKGYLAGEPEVTDPEALSKASLYYDYYRPVMVSLVKCDRVLIEDVTLQNSPAWNVHPLFCSNLTIRRAVIRNPYYAQNGDGLDLESCTRVHIHDVQFDVGDDAICMKSGKNEIGRRIPAPTEDVYIHDCIVYHGHGGFVVGSEMSRGVRRIIVENCTFIGTDCGLRFKSAVGRGGVVEDIIIDGIYMMDIPGEGIIFNMGYKLTTMDKIDEETLAEMKPEDIPEFRNITMKHIYCRGAKQAVRIEGLEQMPVHDITIADSYFLAEKGYSERFAENITMRNVVIEEAVF